MFIKLILRRSLSQASVPINSKALHNDIPNKVEDINKPIVLFSLISKFPKESKVNMDFEKFTNWLKQNNSGYEPATNLSLYNLNNNYDTKIDGIVFKNLDKENLISYFEVLENGFVECGLSSTITYAGEVRGSDKIMAEIYLSQIIGYEMMFLGFAKKYYEFIKYYDNVLLQLSFVNVLNLKLNGFHDKYRGDMRRYERSNIKNSQHNNFVLTFNFNPKSLNHDGIVEICKKHSERICRAFGLDRELCFDENENMSTSHLNDGLI